MLFITCIDKKLFCYNKDVLFICTYVHPEGSPFYSAFDLNDGINVLEDCICDTLVKLNNVDILMCGDFNGSTCTSNLIPDYVDVENVYNFDCTGLSNFIIRKSQDSVLNTYGKKLLLMCASLGLCMLNGICNGDLNGCYTYICDTGSSVNDYFLCSSDYLDNFFSKITLHVADRIESDHLPLEFTITYNHKEHISGNVNNEEVSGIPVFEKYQWNVEPAAEFFNRINSEKAHVFFDKINNLIDCDVNSALFLFNSFVKEQATDMKKKYTDRKEDEGEMV